MDTSLTAATLEASPLSAAFTRAWCEWLEVWDNHRTEDFNQSRIGYLAEQATSIAKKLWRNAFSAVGDSGGQQAKATLYAFVALLDEQLLFEPWPGQIIWQERPLEMRLFGSRTAGERLPVAINHLIKERDPSKRDLANVYLQCLMLGFQGRLRSGKGQAIHEQWRRSLFAFAHHRLPSENDTTALLASPASGSPQQMPVRKSLPDAFRLSLAIALVFLLLMGVSQMLWWDITQPLRTSLERSG